jgi:hypothetical protein
MITKRQQKRLGKAWRSVLEEGKSEQLHLSSHQAQRET